MGFEEHIGTFAGLPVATFDPEETTVVDGAHAWRLAVGPDDDDEDFENLLSQFRGTTGVESVGALILGEWGGSMEGMYLPDEELVAAAEWLPNLTALFLAELTYDECEVSWIEQCDVSPFLKAYQRLEVLRVRGAKDLAIGPLRHESLRELAFESGGLPASVVQEVGACDLPQLEHLELWLGAAEYGGDSTVEDLAPILAGARFPRLRSLALRDMEIADEVAAAVAGAPVVAQLHTLDLSLGVLSDRGAEALLAGQPLTHLKRLDLHRHYLSEEMAARLVAELSGVDVDVADRQVEGEYGRYVAVAE